MPRRPEGRRVVRVGRASVHDPRADSPRSPRSRNGGLALSVAPSGVWRNAKPSSLERLAVGRLSLEEALALLILIAKYDPPLFRRAAVRWLERLVQERQGLE